MSTVSTPAMGDLGLLLTEEDEEVPAERPTNQLKDA